MRLNNEWAQVSKKIDELTISVVKALADATQVFAPRRAHLTDIRIRCFR